MKHTIKCLPVVFFLIFSGAAFGQTLDTEFQKGYLLLFKINNGVVTNFHNAPDLYAGGLSLNPQFTVKEHLLRLGANAGFVYTNKKLSGLFGPMLALKMKNFNLSSLAGLANLQLIAEANWGTDKQQMAGGGFGLDILQKAQLNFTLQRDYNLNSWWLQTHIAIKLNKKKTSVPIFNR
jgi:hypothetical protein